jgi:hypothetical protein
MRTPLGRTTTLASIAMIVGTIGAASWLSYAGLCFSQNRFLSNAELFDAAISEVIRRPSHQIVTSRPGGVTFRSVNLLKYKDVAEFRQLNPNCCKLVPHNIRDRGPFVDFSDRLFGGAAKIVSVTYTVEFTEEGGQSQSVSATEEYAISNCGRAWDARH